MDSSFSAKRLDGSGSADPQTFQSDYFIPVADVEQFRNDAHRGPNTVATTCSLNWSATKAAKEDKICVFEQTGIFVLVCQHGFVECIAEIKHSVQNMVWPRLIRFFIAVEMIMPLVMT
ncbi:hypothetical protein JVU11DRAFT_12128 [Chiua virens]|nr:hypothetical protein JVU11DRAFT_12128 [Chiua virens]